MRYLARVQECEAEPVILYGQRMMACLIGDQARLLPWSAFDAVFEQEEIQPLPFEVVEAESIGEPVSPKPKRAKRAKAPVSGSSTRLIDQVRAAITGQARSMNEIAEHIGFQGEGKARQPLYSVMHQLKQLPTVERLEDPTDGVVRWLLKEGA